jgi:menaquinone-dependent protoporphyrinogen oxidase
VEKWIIRRDRTLEIGEEETTMNIMVLYGTSEGQTRKVARYVADQLREYGVDVTVRNILDEPQNIKISGYDAVILAGRVHAGQYQRQLVKFIREHRSEVSAIPNAFLSVSMSAAGLRPGDMERAQGYAAALANQTGWAPLFTEHVAGARLYTRHNAVARWLLGLVDGNRFDTSRDHEWTDWNELRLFAEIFVKEVTVRGVQSLEAAAS